MFARGSTRVRGASELRVKESDRIEAIVRLVRGFGGDVEEYRDGFHVRGRGKSPHRAGRVSSSGDHRIAMAAAVAACGTKGVSVIEGADAVSVSFPGFYGMLEGCTA
jgi:3-phosphoshikimate 1-carboxyvinyltransferase